MNTPNFITVPETILPNGVVVPTFQVSQYLCSRDTDGNPGSRLAITMLTKPVTLLVTSLSLNYKLWLLFTI